MYAMTPALPLAAFPCVACWAARKAWNAAPPAAPPSIGREAVMQAQNTWAPPVANARTAPTITEWAGPKEWPEIPPDSPPVKGLGIPGLHTARVGDMDQVSDLQSPQSLAVTRAALVDLLGALADPIRPQMDRRV